MISPEEAEVIRDARQKGLTLEDIRDCFDGQLAVGSIGRICKGMPGPREVKRERVLVAVRDTGLTYREASLAFGASVKSVYLWCRHLKLQRDPKYRLRRERLAAMVSPA